ncbi:MAG: type II CAAX prenyl endopeptidase Rce1 family protein [Paracoccaceae bacterium]
MPAALLMSWTLNVVRIAGLVLIGAYVSPAHALQGFHTYAGWTGFLLTALALMWASRWGLRARAPGPAARPRDGTRGVAGDDGDPDPADPGPAVGNAAGIADLAGARGRVRDDRGSDGPRAAARGAPVAARAGPAGRAGDAGGLATGIAWVLFLPPEARPTVSAGAVPWVLGAVIVLPAAQELFFRGYLIARAGASMPLRVAAVLLGAVVFGALQAHWVAGALAGLVFGGLVLRSGRTADAVGAHVLAQAVLAGVVLA